MEPLTAAISEAGGCGVLGATFCTPDELRKEIRAVRKVTDKPFGVDLLIPGDIPEDLSAREAPPFPEFLEDLMPKIEGLKGNPPPPLTIELARAQVEVTLEEKVPLMVSALGTPRRLVEECHAVGTKVMSMVGPVRHAPRLEQMGVDIIVAQGMEAGGHVGTVTTMVLVPSVVDAVNVPVLAAGGIIDGRGIAAGMMLGAQGAWIGTSFKDTEEATAPDAHKQGNLNANETRTEV